MKKIRNVSVNENYIYCSKVLFFKTTDLYTVYLFSEYAQLTWSTQDKK